MTQHGVLLEEDDTTAGADADADAAAADDFPFEADADDDGFLITDELRSNRAGFLGERRDEDVVLAMESEDGE